MEVRAKKALGQHFLVDLGIAADIVDALTHVGVAYGVPLQIVFEPHKGHPKDWANPGRVSGSVRVLPPGVAAASRTTTMTMNRATWTATASGPALVRPRTHRSRGPPERP